MRSLFWKIFAAVWFANIVIMVGTTHTVLMLAKLDAREERVKKEAKEIAQEVLSNLEAMESQWMVPWSRYTKHRYEYDLVSGRLHPLPPFMFDTEVQIQDASGQIVFGSSRDLRQISNNSVEFSLEGSDGQPYQVLAIPPEEPLMVLEELTKRMQSISMLVILMVSGLVSFLLTSAITRPIKLLGRHARTLADGDLDSRVEGGLITREDEIGDLAREFNLMADQLGGLIESKQQLLHDVSHELRAPLARLQAAAAIAQQKAGDTAGNSLNRIEQECSRMNALIQEILNLARMEQINTEFTRLNLSQLLNELTTDVRYEYHDHPIHLALPKQDIYLKGNTELLRRALENILRNACKHTPADTPIDLSLKQEKQQLILSIRDHGNGVAPEDIEKLFSPFYRAGNQMHTEGFGLGLSIATRAIDRHRGSITASNHPDGGLDIQINLPLTTR